MKYTNWIIAAAVVLASVSPAELISFQQGDLRVDGVLVDSSYVMQSVTLRGGDQADTVVNGTVDWIGDHNANNPMRGLYSFDLSYIETLAAGRPYIINSVQLKLTVANANTSNYGPNAQFRASLSLPFDETTATYNNPGPGHAAGGTVGANLGNLNVTAGMVSTVDTVMTFGSTVPFVNAVSNVLASADSSTINIIVKKTEETAKIHGYFRPGANDAANVERRPELLVDITIIPEPATLPLVMIAMSMLLVIRRMTR